MLTVSWCSWGWILAKASDGSEDINGFKLKLEQFPAGAIQPDGEQPEIKLVITNP